MRRSLSITACFLIAALVVTVDQAGAARIHVKTSGTLADGISLADDWADSNCYASLALAATQAAAGDSILFFTETHQLNEAVALPAFVGNLDLSQVNSNTSIVCGPLAQMTVSAILSRFEARGLTFVGDGAESDLSAFRINGGLTNGGTVTFDSCVFQSLKASDLNARGGSCLDVGDNDTNSALMITSCLFQDNVNRGRGGAVLIENGWTVQVQNTQFIDNDSRRGATNGSGKGGAIAVISPIAPSTVTCDSCLFQGNRSWGPGGSIFLDDAALTLIDTEMSESQSAVELTTEWCAGAGILMRRTADSHLEPIFLTVENCVFTNNQGNIGTNPWAGDGGAILVKGIADRYVEVSVAGTLFRDNYNAQGGGLYIGRFATGEVNYCRFLDNDAYLQGGAAFKGGAFAENLGETVVYNYCEFSGNRAGVLTDGSDSPELGRGGAFTTRVHTRAEFHNCTFYNNTAHGPLHEGDAVILPNEGQPFDSDLKRCDFVNTVFYGTEGNSVQVVARTGAIGRLDNCAFVPGQVQLAGSTPLDPVELSSFPFVDPSDLRPGTESPLLDTALDEGQSRDLMGFTVPVGEGPDIGCYELQNVTTPVPDMGRATTPLRIFPNPFNPRTMISYELDTAAVVTLAIYDLGGRRVASLEQGRREVGRHELSWNGVDDDGRNLPTAVYFVRFQAGATVSTQKLALIR